MNFKDFQGLDQGLKRAMQSLINLVQSFLISLNESYMYINL